MPSRVGRAKAPSPEFLVQHMLLTAAMCALMLAVSGCASRSPEPAVAGRPVTPTTAPAQTALAQQAKPTTQSTNPEATIQAAVSGTMAATQAGGASSAATNPTSVPPTATTANSKPSKPQATSESPPKPTPIYKAGDTVAVEGRTISLLAVKRMNDSIEVELQLHNTGQKNVDTSANDFFVKAADGTILRSAYQGTYPISSVLPGDKNKGTVVYQAPNKITGLKLYYYGTYEGYGAVVFGLDDDAIRNPFPVPDFLVNLQPFSPGKTYKVDDAVDSGKIVVKLSEATFQDGVLVCNVVFYNRSSRNVFISAYNSFESKDAEGTAGRSQLTLVDVSVLNIWLIPDDTLRFNLRWKYSPDAKGIKVYYASELFDFTGSSPRIVWTIN
jgi:hypothetical protein